MVERVPRCRYSVPTSAGVPPVTVIVSATASASFLVATRFYRRGAAGRPIYGRAAGISVTIREGW